MKIAILEDDPETLNEASAELVAGGHEIVLQLRTSEKAAEQIRKARPAAVVVDLRMDHCHAGLGCLKELQDDRQDIRHLVAYSSAEDVDLVIASFLAGADAYLWKSDPKHSLTSTLASLEADEAIISPKLARLLILRFRVAATYIPALAKLSEREFEYLKLRAQGLSETDIRDAMKVSRSRTHQYMRSIVQKWKLPSGNLEEALGIIGRISNLPDLKTKFRPVHRCGARPRADARGYGS